MDARPSFVVSSRDGTGIAVFASGSGRPLVLVHGTAGDHTTFRVVAPMLAEDHEVFAIDRRGRGASADGPGYAIEREFEDVAAVAEAVARRTGRSSVDVAGHSYGGRVALGAALRTPAIRRLVVYEGAPPAPGWSYHAPALESRLQGHFYLGLDAAILEDFLREVVGMDDADIAAYKANPVWPARVATAPTILRELRAGGSPAASLEALGGVALPVLQILGGRSSPVFKASTTALDRRLAHGRVVVIDDARHAAHHTHPDELVAAIREFLTAPNEEA